MSMLKTQPVRQAKSQSNPKPPMPERRLENGGASEDEIRPLAYESGKKSGCPIWRWRRVLVGRRNGDPSRAGVVEVDSSGVTVFSKAGPSLQF